MIIYTLPDFSDMSPDAIVRAVIGHLQSSAPGSMAAAPIAARALFLAAAEAIATTLREDAEATLAALGGAAPKPRPKRDAPAEPKAPKTDGAVDAGIMEVLATCQPRTTRELAERLDVPEKRVAESIARLGSQLQAHKAGRGWRYGLAAA
jgi:hypothetical protein